MSTVSAQSVKELRERTGAGMMDCKKALEEANGSFDGAIEILKKKGQKISLSRADKDANEGCVFTKISENNQLGVILVLACETDFVALTADFQGLGNKLVNFAISKNILNLDQLVSSTIDGKPISEMVIELTGKVGEKIDIKAYKVLSSDCIVSYIHSGSKLGVLLGFEGVKEVKNIGSDIAMQIAAMNPLAIRVEDIDPIIVEKELIIAKEKSEASGKPADMVEKIAKGMVAKVLEQNTLLCQPFVKDSNVTVEQYLKANLAGASIKNFIRLSVG